MPASFLVDESTPAKRRALDLVARLPVTFVVVEVASPRGFLRPDDRRSFASGRTRNRCSGSRT